MTRRQRIWTAALTVALIAGIVLIATAANGQETTKATERMTVEIPIDTVFRGAPGDLFLEGTFTAAPGDSCVAELTFTNSPIDEPSIHLNNDILVGPVTFTDVENGTFEAAALTFVATGSNDVAVRLGSNVFSGGFTLEVTCNPPTTTTEPTVPSTSTTTTGVPPEVSTTTTVSVPPVTTTTLSPPPVGGVATGGGHCADGACDGFSLSPLLTWIGIGVVWALLAGLIWAFIAGATRRSDG